MIAVGLCDWKSGSRMIPVGYSNGLRGWHADILAVLLDTCLTKAQQDCWIDSADWQSWPPGWSGYGGCAVTANDLKTRLAEAKRAAAVAPPEVQDSREWPDADARRLDEALVDLAVEMYMHGAKISVGPTPDASGIWARISYPKWSPAKSLAGMTAFTASSDLERALRKLAQLRDAPENLKVWKPDQFAR